tara:strand:+ start:23489 stop:24460 length:972 start_codon:yes stop_codon:yes gene_type:complete
VIGTVKQAFDAGPATVSYRLQEDTYHGYAIPNRDIDNKTSTDEDWNSIFASLSPYNRGYEPLGGQTLEDGAPPDLKEGFYIGEEISVDHPRLREGSFNLGPNHWPADLPGFETTMMTYYAEMLALGETLMQGIALSLGLEGDYFADFCRDPLTALKLLHYPPQPANPDPGEKGCGAHTDFGGITMLMQDDNGGLQVLGNDGRWLHAPPVPDAYVVNLADMISRWTNDMYRSTLHRVINVSGTERYSVPFFFSGRPAHEVVALDCCLADGETPKYPPTTVEKHMRDMYARTYWRSEAIKGGCPDLPRELAAPGGFDTIKARRFR